MPAPQLSCHTAACNVRVCILKTEPVWSSELLVNFYQTACCHILLDSVIQSTSDFKFIAQLLIFEMSKYWWGSKGISVCCRKDEYMKLKFVFCRLFYQVGRRQIQKMLNNYLYRNWLEPLNFKPIFLITTLIGSASSRIFSVFFGSFSTFMGKRFYSVKCRNFSPKLKALFNLTVFCHKCKWILYYL